MSACEPSIGEVETGGSLGLDGYGLRANCVLNSLKDLYSKENEKNYLLYNRFIKVLYVDLYLYMYVNHNTCINTPEGILSHTHKTQDMCL